MGTRKVSKLWIMALLLVVFVAGCGREQGTLVPTLTAVTGINPNRGTQGQTLGVTLTGTGFETGATINLSGALIGVSNLAVMSTTQITATFAIATNAALGPVNISVTTSGQTTNAVPFTIAPALTVISEVPPNGASDVPINQVLTATFSQAVNCATVTTSSFFLTGPSGAVAGTVACSSATATFTPASLLASNPTYTATLTTAIMDPQGDPLLSNFGWSFSTAPLPTVTATIPANGAIYVAINQVLTATFNGAMDCATLTTSSFTLTGPGGAVAGTVTCSDTSASFTPTSLLTASTIYTATITTGATNVGGAALASKYVWSFTTSPNPAVASTIPINGATGVPVNQVLSATFNEGINCSTVTSSTFTLSGPGGAVAGTVGCAGTSATSATFTPTSLLASNSSYTATLTTGIANPQGEAMLSNYVWTFTTGLAPIVTSTVPANGATIVPVNQVLSATFSEQMNCSTITASSFTLTAPGPVSVPGIVACAGTSATFTPTSLLLGATAYTATITTGATNAAGAALAGNYVWTFTTVGGLTVTATIPTNGATAVPTDQQITAIFSQPAECSTITTSSFTLTGPGGAVGGTIGCVGASATSATFTPSTNLAINTTYKGTITTAVTEPGPGFTAIVIPYVWTFKTGPTPSTVPPTVTAVTPLNLATGVGFNTTITAMFDEAMDPTTMTGSTFTLATGCAPAGTLVSGAVTYNAINNIITLTPGSNLAPLTCYTATVTTGAKNLAEVAMAAPFIWTFTTGAAPDLTPPTVISTDPLNLATDVPVNQNITATFSKAMNDNTINTTTFTLFQGTTPIPGTVAYIAGSNTAIFVPTSNLVLDTVYTATITTGVADLAGNFMVSNYVWSFTTTGPVVVAPTVLSTNPANNATGVCINATVNATFSTAMDPTTINTATFTVTAGGLPVTGTVALDVTGTIATFTPLSNLAPSTPYIATITTGATDVAGNALASDYVWTFTTGTAAACLPPPTLGAATPFGGFGGGAGMTNQGINTVIHGDIGTTGASTTMTGFHDNLVAYLPPAGCIYTETPLNIGDVTGQIFTAPPPPTITCPNEGTAVTFATATAAAAAALVAYNNLAGLPSGPDPGAGQLGGLTLAPGTYTAAGGSFLLTGSDLTLDAKGNANAVWVFQMATSLTVGAAGAPRSVILINGAKAGNVFWQVGSAATINAAGGGTFAGTIIAKAGVVVSTAGNAAITTINGRALGLNASVTLVNTVINVP